MATPFDQPRFLPMAPGLTAKAAASVRPAAPCTLTLPAAAQFSHPKHASLPGASLVPGCRWALPARCCNHLPKRPREFPWWHAHSLTKAAMQCQCAPYLSLKLSRGLKLRRSSSAGQGVFVTSNDADPRQDELLQITHSSLDVPCRIPKRAYEVTVEVTSQCLEADSSMLIATLHISKRHSLGPSLP